MAICDAIIVGLGAMGSAAAYELSLRGKRVLGLEAFTAAHDKGSSHGSSRIIRQAYYEHPAYVPLVLRAYELWERLQANTGQGLLHITGGLSIGLPTSQMVSGSIESARTYGLAHEILNHADISRRFPPFVPSPQEIAVYEAKAGYLRPEDCIRHQLIASADLGADLHFEEPMLSWKANTSGEGVSVRTGRGMYHADHLILTAGAWASQVLRELCLPLEVRRKVMFWFAPAAGIEQFLPDRFPIYLWQPDASTVFYGFPATEGSDGGVKVALHTGGEACTPDSIERTTSRSDEKAIRSAIATRIPGLNGSLVKTQTCMYTMTPDENFIIERHREYPQVSIAAGFSGHGFKFSTVVGEILADLATNGHTNHNIELFSSQRFRQSPTQFLAGARRRL